MDFETSKVYVQIDNLGHITRCEGGYSMSNIENVDEWILIDEGYGDRFNLCQSNYFDEPLVNEDGTHNFKLVEGVVGRTTDEEKADEKASMPAPPPTSEERIIILEQQNKELENCILELAEVLGGE